MRNREKKQRRLIILILIAFLLIFEKKVKAISLEDYCRDGYYKIPTEEVCSRAPKCGGKSYEEVEALPAPNPQRCMGDKDGQRIGCKGYVPLCCYELARLGDPVMCIGYWERLWCHPEQCNKVDPEKGRVCNNGQPGKCGCGHAFSYWCQGADFPLPPVPLEERLGLILPSPTPTVTPTKSATTTPVLTSFPTLILTPTPLPTSSPVLFPTFTLPPKEKPSPVSFPSLLPTSSGGLTPFPSFLEIKKIPLIIAQKIGESSLKAAQRTKIAAKKLADPPKKAFLEIKRIDRKIEDFVNERISFLVLKIFNFMKF